MFPTCALLFGTLFLCGNTMTAYARDFFYADFATLISRDFPDGVSLSLYKLNQLTPKARTHVIVHPFSGSSNDRWIRIAGLFYFAMDHNIIVIDYSTLTRFNYFFAARFSSGVGYEVGLLLANLASNNGLDPSTVDMIGFSLGAQVAGFAGYYFRRISGAMIDAIIGLDPAGFLFQGRFTGTRKLDATDAIFVQVIHTTYSLGSREIVADVDFIINDPAKSQPGCTSVGPGCSHFRAVELYLESLATDCVFDGGVCYEPTVDVTYTIGVDADTSILGLVCLVA